MDCPKVLHNAAGPPPIHTGMSRQRSRHFILKALMDKDRDIATCRFLSCMRQRSRQGDMFLYSAADNDRDIATRRFHPGVNNCDIVGPLLSRASEHSSGSQVFLG